eukprot:5362418-Karenia_brevis.AAC.1
MALRSAEARANNSSGVTPFVKEVPVLDVCGPPRMCYDFGAFRMRPVAVHEAPVQRCTLRTHMQLPDQCEEERSFDVFQLAVPFQIH